MKSEIKRLRSSIYVTNSFYLFDGEGHALIIDPAESFSKAEGFLEGNIPTAIYLTHGHFDHTYDCELFRQKYGTKVFVHELFPITGTIHLTVFRQDTKIGLLTQTEPSKTAIHLLSEMILFPLFIPRDILKDPAVSIQKMSFFQVILFSKVLSDEQISRWAATIQTCLTH